MAPKHVSTVTTGWKCCVCSWIQHTRYPEPPFTPKACGCCWDFECPVCGAGVGNIQDTMNSTTLVGYAYGAALHCVDCTLQEYPDISDGNTYADIDPIFADNEDWQGEHCEDCGMALKG